jgi:hypothetical protein
MLARGGTVFDGDQGQARAMLPDRFLDHASGEARHGAAGEGRESKALDESWAALWASMRDCPLRRPK